MNDSLRLFRLFNDEPSSGIDLLRELFRYINECITKQGTGSESIAANKREFRVTVLHAHPGFLGRLIEEDFTAGLWCKYLALGLDNWGNHILRFDTETINIYKVESVHLIATDMEYIAEIEAKARIGSAVENCVIRINWFKDNATKKEEVTPAKEETVKSVLSAPSSIACSVCEPTPRDAIFNKEQQERKARKERELFEGKVNTVMQFIEDNLKEHKENPDDASRWLDIGAETVFLVGKPPVDILTLIQSNSEVMGAVNERYRSVGWNYVALQEDDTIVIC